MGIFSKFNFQNVFGVFNFKNNITQINNEQHFENNNILDDYFQNIFEELDLLLQNGQLSIVENKLNDIALKKQDRFSNDIERKILKYKAFIAINKENKDELESIINLLKNYGEDSREMDDVKFNIAIFYKDDNLFYELKNRWEKIFDKNRLDKNEAIFLYYTKQYTKLIKKFEADEFNDSNDIKSIMARTYSIVDKDNEAEKIFSETKDIDDENFLEYIIHKARYIFKNLNNFTQEEKKNNLDICMENINKVCIKNLNRNQYKQLMLIKMQILNLIDCEKALKISNEIILEFKNDFEIEVIYGDILEKNGKLLEAEKIYEQLITSNLDEHIVMRILIVKSDLKKWDEIIHIFNKYKEDLKDENFVCRYIYGQALIKCGDKETAKAIENDSKKELSLLLQAKIYIDELEKCKLYLEQIEKCVSENDFILLDVVAIYEELKQYEKACEILYKGSNTQLDMYKKFVEIVIKKKLEKYYDDTTEIYNNIYKNLKNSFVDESIYYIYVQKQNYRGAYVIAKKLYDYKKSLNWTNEFFRMKVLNNDYDDLENMIKILESSNEPKYLITSAEGYSILNDFQRSKELCYRAFFYLKDKDIEILSRISAIGIKANKNEHEDYNDEIHKRVEIDDVVILIEEDGSKLIICLNREMYYQIEKIDLGIYHISNNNELWFEVLGKNINYRLIYNKKTYVIKDIINKNDYMFRIAFSERVSKGKEPIKQLQILPDDKDLDVIKEEMRRANESIEKRISFYMKKEAKFNIPIYFIINDEIKIRGVINDLLFIKKYEYMAGTPNRIKSAEKVTLTLVSTIFLAEFGILKDFIKYYDVYVGKQLVDLITKLRNELVNNYNHKEMTLYLLDDKLYRDEKDSNYKREQINFYKNILTELEDTNIVKKSIFDNSRLIDIPEEFLKSCDIESAEIAMDIEGIVFIDDLFTQDVFNGFYQKIKISNTAGFLSSILFKDYKKYNKILEKLIKGKYKYVFTDDSLVNVIISFQIDKKSDLNKFKNFIRLIIENDIDNYYKRIMSNLCLRISFVYRWYFIYKVKVDIITGELYKKINI